MLIEVHVYHWAMPSSGHMWLSGPCSYTLREDTHSSTSELDTIDCWLMRELRRVTIMVWLQVIEEQRICSWHSILHEACMDQVLLKLTTIAKVFQHTNWYHFMSQSFTWHVSSSFAYHFAYSFSVFSYDCISRSVWNFTVEWVSKVGLNSGLSVHAHLVFIDPLVVLLV